MTHPEDLLPDYVDGTLGDAQRAVVDAHLRGCATCREEVLLARASVTAMGSLDEVPVPFGVTGPVLAEAGRRFERRRKVAWERLQWSAGLAAAAALILVVVLNLGEGGETPIPAQGPADTAATGAGAAEAAGAYRFAAGFQGLERQQGVNYDQEGVRAVARDTATELQTEAAQEAAEAAPPATLDATMDSASTDRALSCLERGGAPLGDERDSLLRLIEAEFDGTPAYIAAFLESPGADQPPDKVVIYVMAIDDCSFLSGATLPI